MGEQDQDHCPGVGRVRFLGGGMAMLHHEKADGSHEDSVGRVVPCQEGKPLFPGVPFVIPDERGAPPGSFGRVLYEAKGPGQVATPAYREGWERTFRTSLN
jgi:hypothetical protein